MAKLQTIWAGVVVILSFAALAAAQGAPAAGDAEVEKWIAVLKSDTSSHHDKVAACQRLQLIGDSKAVPVLASMLGHEKLGHAARMALESNPDPAVDAAFRKALGTVSGEPLIGVIDSIGRRRDAAAVGALVERLRRADEAAGAAAARALGHIGNEMAIASIERSIPTAPPSLRTALLEAYLIAADQACEDDRREQAARMFGQLLQHDAVPVPVRAAAMRGLIVSRGHADGTRLALEHLKGDDSDMFDVALQVLQELKAPELPAAYAAELAALPADRQVRLIGALSARHGSEVVAALVTAADAADGRVRIAAIRALAQLGDPAGLGVLLKAAVADDADLATAARAGLVAVRGTEADAAILAMLTSDKPATRRAAIDILSRRNVPDAAQALLKAARDADEPTRLAAIRAIGESAPPGELAALLRLLLGAKSGPEAEAAERAAAAVIARAEPREAMAEPVIASMADAGAAGRCALLRLLPAAGGARALEAVRDATKAFDKQVQDAAIRALCDWPTADAATDVLAVAKGGDNPVHKRLALRAYVRMISDKNLPVEQRAAMSGEAGALAQAADEKKLLLGVLGAVPAKGALDLVVRWLDDPAVSEEAVAAALAIGESLRATEPEAVTAALTKAAATTKNQDLARRANDLIGRTRANTP